MLEVLLMGGAFIMLIWLFVARPQKKRFEEMRAAVDALGPGSRILLTSGIFATISHMGNQQAVVELAPGLEITVLKSNIARAAEEGEEEFLLTDDEVSDEVEEDELVDTTEAEDGDMTFDPTGSDELESGSAEPAESDSPETDKN